jgi:hypothetical protein
MKYIRFKVRGHCKFHCHWQPERVAAIKAIKENGPNTADRIFSPTPNIEDAGAFPSQ